jgi:hypothetical protein
VQAHVQINARAQISQGNSQNVRQTPNLRVQTTLTATPDSSSPESCIACKVDFHLPEEDMVTPRREVNMRSSVPFTPVGAQADDFPYYCPLCMEHFKDILVSPCCGNYACAQCSTDYLATQTQSFAAGANLSGGGSSSTINGLLGLVRAHEQASRKGSCVQPLQCPHCRQSGYCPSKVRLGGRVRNYATTPQARPGPVKPRQSPSASGYDADCNSTLTPGSCGRGERSTPYAMDCHPGAEAEAEAEETSAAREQVPSPVRIGDSFDSLKRKMMPFQLPGASTQAQACSSSSPGAVARSSASAPALAGVPSPDRSAAAAAAVDVDMAVARQQWQVATPADSGSASHTDADVDWMRSRSSNQDSPDVDEAIRALSLTAELRPRQEERSEMQAEGEGKAEAATAATAAAACEADAATEADFTATLGLLFAAASSAQDNYEQGQDAVHVGACAAPIAACH